jgi:hypothetical protein
MEWHKYIVNEMAADRWAAYEHGSGFVLEAMKRTMKLEPISHFGKCAAMCYPRFSALGGSDKEYLEASGFQGREKDLAKAKRHLKKILSTEQAENDFVLWVLETEEEFN